MCNLFYSSLLAHVHTDEWELICWFCTFLRLHYFLKGENHCQKYLIRKLFYSYFHNFLISSHIHKSGNCCWREQISLPLLHFFIA